MRDGWSDLFEEAREFGVVDIPSWSPCCFRVFVDQHRVVSMSTSGQPVDAHWSGGSLIVKMDDGQIRRYYSLSESSYDIIYT